MTLCVDHGHNLGMAESVVEASTFQAQCFAILDDVEANRSTIIVTKNGRPVAKVVPLDEPRPTVGSVTLLSESDVDYFCSGESWNEN